MRNPLQVSFHDLQHSAEIETFIEEKFEKVKAESPDVTKCHVVLEKLSKHHQKGNMACVRLDLKISHFEDIVVTENCLADKTMLKSAVIKVFKQGVDLARQYKKHRLEKKRMPLGELPSALSVEAVDES
jgi:ribosome-associated translation inhibitor RaiA